MARFVGVQGAFFTSISVLFALFTGFLGNDVWERQRQAHRAVHMEQDALTAIGTLGAALSADGAPIQAALRTYVTAIIEDEWPRMADQEESAKAAQALAVLLQTVARASVGAQAGAATHAALVDLTLRVRTARNDRLTISDAEYDGTKWLTVLLLGLLTQLGISSVQLDRARPQALALGLFTAAAVLTLGLLASRERPFDGASPISPAAFSEVLKALPPA